MSNVVKSKQKKSKFEVEHNYYKMRADFMDLIFRNFGFNLEVAKTRVKNQFGNEEYDKLSPEEKKRYDNLMYKYEQYYELIIADEKIKIQDCLGKIGEEIFSANSIYPMYMEELIVRRIHQDIAIGQCNRLMQELQFTISTLPLDINKYTRFAEMINKEIDLIKGWRKSDNKFKHTFEVTSVSASNFANVNSNGNANYNTASNSNGVRPDSEPVT